MKELVKASYSNNELHAATVERIADRLNRTDLKAYIRGLKEFEKRSTVYIEAPVMLSAADQKEIEKIFAKKVVSRKNPELLLGLRIRDNDDVYNMNLKTSLERIAAYAGE